MDSTELVAGKTSGHTQLAAEPITVEQSPARKVLPVIEERFSVTKRIVDQGGYRLTKRVENEQVTVDDALQREEVSVERRPIGLMLDTDMPPAQRYEGDVQIISVVKEVLVTEKRLLLVEEIRITRHRSTYHEPQVVTLRKEEIAVDLLEPKDSSYE